MSKAQQPKPIEEAPHIVKTIVASNGVTVHIADNYCRNLPPEELEWRRREARKVAWRILERAAARGLDV